MSSPFFSHLSDAITFPIRAAYPNPMKMLRLPSDPRVNYPLFYVLFSLNAALIANLVALSWLWNWYVGWILLVGIITTIYVVTLLHKTTELLIEQIQFERDQAVEESIESDRTLRETYFMLTEHCLVWDEDGLNPRCRQCESTDPLLDDPHYKFNSLVHKPGCEVPGWRVQMEKMDFVLPENVFDEFNAA